MKGVPWAVQGPRWKQQALPEAAVAGTGFSVRNENIKHRKGGSAMCTRQLDREAEASEKGGEDVGSR